MKIQIALVAMLIASIASSSFAQEAQQEVATNKIAEAFFDAEKVVFLGDSITYHGEFLAVLESTLVANDKSFPELLNLGLSSETCSGESEPAHPWPRPNVHERFERMLAKVTPDVLVVNYGMNDGIYHPFDKARFESYKAGINKIIEAAEKSDGSLKVILVTPPPFDPLPLKSQGSLAPKDADEFNWKTVYENYDSEVMAVYSDWILEQSDRVVGCIDLRTPILNHLAEKRVQKPDYRISNDGVHVDSIGHKLIGHSIAMALELDTSLTVSSDVFDLIKQKQTILRNSWLTAVGHKRPGIKDGMPLPKAIASVMKIGQQIEEKLNKPKATKNIK